MALRVLLTGYEPFGGEPVNPSARLAADLAATPPPHPRLELRAAILPVDRERFCAALAQAVATHRPDVIVALGQATGRARVELESIARNALDFRGERDNGGHAAAGESLQPGGPPRRHVRLPAASLAAELAAAGLPVGASLDAGRHLCNALLYELLGAHADRPALFVHVPLLPEQAARRAQGEAALPEELSRRCVAALLRRIAERLPAPP